jgi:sensor histidine kinase YesM
VRQISDINTVANKKVIPHFLWILFLSIITLGIYFAYHEYKMTKEIHLRFYGESFPMMEVLLALLTFMALWFVVDTYQQYILNQIAEGKKVVRPPLLFSFFY